MLYVLECSIVCLDHINIDMLESSIVLENFMFRLFLKKY